MTENQISNVNRNIQNSVVPRSIEAARQSKLTESKTSLVQLAVCVFIMMSGNALPKPMHDIANGALFPSLMNAGTAYQAINFSTSGMGNAFTTSPSRLVDHGLNAMEMSIGEVVAVSRADSEEGDGTRTLLNGIVGCLAAIIIPKTFGKIKKSMNSNPAASYEVSGLSSNYKRSKLRGIEPEEIKPFLDWIRAQQFDPGEVFQYIEEELSSNLDGFHKQFNGKSELSGQKISYTKEEFVIMMKEIIEAYKNSDEYVKYNITTKPFYDNGGS